MTLSSVLLDALFALQARLRDIPTWHALRHCQCKTAHHHCKRMIDGCDHHRVQRRACHCYRANPVAALPANNALAHARPQDCHGDEGSSHRCRQVDAHRALAAGVVVIEEGLACVAIIVLVVQTYSAPRRHASVSDTQTEHRGAKACSNTKQALAGVSNASAALGCRSEHAQAEPPERHAALYLSTCASSWPVARYRFEGVQGAHFNEA